MTKIQSLLFIFSLTILTMGAAYSSNSDPGVLLNSAYAEPQQGPVTGIVTDAATGEVLLGVTVVVKGTTIGQITDPNGRFSINIPQQEVVLVFSSVGYASQEVTAKAGSTVNVALGLDVLEMDEVVVIGYGVQKKETVVGSISQASGDQIMNSLRGSDLTNALTGNLPGLITIQSSGIPGGSGAENNPTQIFIRGQKTWNNAQPLILVDGIEREMNDVDPYTVEGISVLKDASATAVFGVKGANGVILITTKRGAIGRPKLSISTSTSAKTISRITERLNSYETVKLKNYVLLNEVVLNESPWGYMIPEEQMRYYRDQTYPEYLPDVNWADEMLKDFSWDKTVNMTISGGTNFVKYFGSLSYLNEGDILRIRDVGQGYNPNFEFNRYNYRSNLDFNISPTTTFTVNLGGYFSSQQRPRQGLITKEWFGLYSFPSNIYPVKYSDGVYADIDDNRWRNQFVESNFTGYSMVKQTQVNSDFQLVQKLDFLTKGLSVKGKFSYDIRASSTGPNLIDNGIMTKYIDKDIMNEIEPGMSAEEIAEIEKRYTTWLIPARSGAGGYDFVTDPISFTNENSNSNSDRNSFYRALNYELSLNYNRDFGKHNVGGLFLMSRNEMARGNIFPTYREDWVGRVVYGYDTRYLLEFNGAYNGSEQFGPDYRFGFFPSVAMGWVVSNESFFEPLKPIVNLMKFRYSNGKVGNDRISNNPALYRWLYLSSWNVTNDRWWFLDTTPAPATSIYPQRFEGIIPNPFIQWETAHKQDVGVEMGFFQNLFRVHFDYFWEERTNIMVRGEDRVEPVYFGTDPVTANLGHVKNEGYEIELDFARTTPGGFRYNIGYALSFSKDLIIRKSDTELSPSYQKEAGYAIDQPRVYMHEGVINSWNDVYTGVLGQSRNDLLPGAFRQIDFNNDGIISVDDQAPYGFTPRPQYSYSPKFGIGYKGLDLNVDFYGVFNVEGQSMAMQGAFGFQQDILYNVHREIAWFPELGIGEEAQLPAPIF
jgi:TonB-linked SusC/RagA family outer membrane protein